MKRSGIIMELNQKQAVVMTSEAEFTTIKREPEMYLGGPVEFKQPLFLGFAFLRFGNFGKNLRTLGLASLATILLLTFTLFFHVNDYRNLNQYAYVTIDINPSVEFVVDPKIIVIQVRNFNEDGRSLLQGKDLINMPLTQVLLTLASRAEQADYFKPDAGRYILVSAVINQVAPEKPDLLETAISQCQTELMERNIQMQYIQATLSQRKTALENQLSTGRYALLAYAEGAGRTMNLETAKTGTIGDLLDQAGLLTNPQNSRNSQITKAAVTGDSAPKNPRVQPTHRSKQANNLDRIFISGQTNPVKPPPIRPNIIIVSNDSIPTPTPKVEVTVTPKMETDSSKDGLLAAAISSAYHINVSTQDITGLRANQNLDYGEIGLLYGLANAAGKTAADILTMKQSGMGWSEIAQSFGLEISAITRKNSSVLKAAKMDPEDQKIKDHLKQEEKNKKATPNPAQAASGNQNANSHSSSKNAPGKGKK